MSNNIYGTGVTTDGGDAKRDLASEFVDLYEKIDQTGEVKPL